MSAFDEIYEQTATFVPTEDWLESQGENWKALANTPIEGDDKPIRTIGQAHFSIECDFQGIPRRTMGLVMGVDRYMDEYGEHRIRSLDHWEYRDNFFYNPDHRKFKHTPRIPLCPIGLGRG